MNSNEPSLKDVAFGDLERELTVTRTVLERLLEEHYGWRPHEKSMNLGELAMHVSDLPGWITATIAHDELDASAAPHSPAELKDRKQLLDRFDANALAAREAIAKFDMVRYHDPWTMRNGEQVIVTRPRSTVYRLWCMNHLIHHRGQLCVYLRLLNVPVPTVYFNSADDPTWVFA